MEADHIYEREKIDLARSYSKSFHVYMIGYLPVVETISVSIAGVYVVINVLVSGEPLLLRFPCPLGTQAEWIVGKTYLRHRGKILPRPDEVAIHRAVSEQHDKFNFEVLYVGQSFGEDGDRDAIDRLLKHETLQKISLTRKQPGAKLAVLLLSLPEQHSSITTFNPRAIKRNFDESRIALGVEKMREATEKERITLFEASLIRYFRPEFNDRFRDSFPSTKNKVLKACYDKDILALLAEISFSEMPFKFFSKHVKPERYVIARHDLHDDIQRRWYFFDQS